MSPPLLFSCLRSMACTSVRIWLYTRTLQDRNMQVCSQERLCHRLSIPSRGPELLLGMLELSHCVPLTDKPHVFTLPTSPRQSPPRLSEKSFLPYSRPQDSLPAAVRYRHRPRASHKRCPRRVRVGRSGRCVDCGGVSALRYHDESVRRATLGGQARCAVLAEGAGKPQGESRF